jgi:hypothetical protein
MAVLLGQAQYDRRKMTMHGATQPLNCTRGTTACIKVAKVLDPGRRGL